MAMGSQYRNQKSGIGRVAPAATFLLLLGVLTVGGIDARALPGVDAYHERVRNAIDAISEYVRQSAEDNRKAGPVQYTDLSIPTEALEVAEAKQILKQMHEELNAAPADRRVRFRPEG